MRAPFLALAAITVPAFAMGHARYPQFDVTKLAGSYRAIECEARDARPDAKPAPRCGYDVEVIASDPTTLLLVESSSRAALAAFAAVNQGRISAETTSAVGCGRETSDTYTIWNGLISKRRYSSSLACTGVATTVAHEAASLLLTLDGDLVFERIEGGRDIQVRLKKN
jgi:hypothetical protein